MQRKLNNNITEFEVFYNQLVYFVKSKQPCFSVRDRKDYKSYLDDFTIVMVGKDRSKPSEYDKETLKNVFLEIKNCQNINTLTLAPFVGRHRSPLLALMIASEVVKNY